MSAESELMSKIILVSTSVSAAATFRILGKEELQEKYIQEAEELGLELLQSFKNWKAEIKEEVKKEMGYQI